MIRLHVRRQKRPNKTYQFRFAMIPQLEGELSINDILSRKDKIGISFTGKITEAEKTEILTKLKSRIVRVYGEPVNYDYILKKLRPNGIAKEAVKEAFKLVTEIQNQGYYEIL